MHVTLSQLKHLLAVIRAGNISKAAKIVHLSQPALSRSIATIEQQTGITLFNRGWSRHKLTPAGAILVAHAERIVREMDAFEHTVKLWSQGIGGTTSFGMGPVTAALFLRRILAMIAEEYPTWHINARVNTGQLLFAELERGELDFIVCQKDMLFPSRPIRSIPIGTTPLSLFARRHHPLTARATVTYDDIAAFPLGRAGIPEPIERGGEHPLHRLPAALVCDDQNILADVMLASDMIILSSKALLRDELAAGLAVEIDCVGTVDTPFDIIWLAERNLSETAEHISKKIKDLVIGSGENSVTQAATSNASL